MKTKKLTTLARKKLVIAALEDIKAHDIQAIDVRKLTSMFDWIVVSSTPPLVVPPLVAGAGTMIGAG